MNLLKLAEDRSRFAGYFKSITWAFNGITQAYQFSANNQTPYKLISELSQIRSKEAFQILPDDHEFPSHEYRFAYEGKKLLRLVYKGNIEAIMEELCPDEYERCLTQEGVTLLKKLIDDILEKDLSEQKINKHFKKQNKLHDANKELKSDKREEDDKKSKKPRTDPSPGSSSSASKKVRFK